MSWWWKARLLFVADLDEHSAICSPDWSLAYDDVPYALDRWDLDPTVCHRSEPIGCTGCSVYSNVYDGKGLHALVAGYLCKYVNDHCQTRRQRQMTSSRRHQWDKTMLWDIHFLFWTTSESTLACILASRLCFLCKNAAVRLYYPEWFMLRKSCSSLSASHR